MPELPVAHLVGFWSKMQIRNLHCKLIAAKQPPFPAQRLRKAWSILGACIFFCLFSTILHRDFGQRRFKWNWNGWNSLLLVTKENLRQIPVVPLLTDSEPIYRFVMHHNSMTVNWGGRERTYATNTMRSTHWQLLFLVMNVDFLQVYSMVNQRQRGIITSVGGGRKVWRGHCQGEANEKETTFSKCIYHEWVALPVFKARCLF